jgi:hypothetical protein
LSDINIKIELGWEIVPFLAVMLGWPGLIVGAALGALAWRRRRWLGGVLGGLAGMAVVGGLRALAL